MIKITHLTKNYGSNCAVDDISFEIQKGETVGFLGPNGAGKSTTMNVLTGFLSASVGTVTIDGIDILADPIAADGVLHNGSGHVVKPGKLFLMHLTVPIIVGFVVFFHGNLSVIRYGLSR